MPEPSAPKEDGAANKPQGLESKKKKKESVVIVSSNKVKKTAPERIYNVNVGVLGHVDSGKTSLVSALSTLLSTASLDKSNQSRERGITLDLGFSALFLQAPWEDWWEDYDLLQFTLVDCPGHASLIRTVMGGAQIIDLVIVVVDVTKGIQAQTTECLVLADMTCEDALLIALNKVDLLPPGPAQSARLAQVEAEVWSVLEKTQFGHPPFRSRVSMVQVSACVGGEKVAALAAADRAADGSHVGSNTIRQALQDEQQPQPPQQQQQGTNKTKNAAEDSLAVAGADKTLQNAGHIASTKGMEELLRLLQTSVRPPHLSKRRRRLLQYQQQQKQRQEDASKKNNAKTNNNNKGNTSTTPPFYFSVDHCFAIRGQGTILTGTCLSGTLTTGASLECPSLGWTRKVKGMQMFRRDVTAIGAGDRAGICVTHVDAKLMERGLVCAPGAVKLVHGAIALVRPVAFFRGRLPSPSKFHISVGHSTVMAQVTFFGATELQKAAVATKKAAAAGSEEDSDNGTVGGLPSLEFSMQDDFLVQEEMWQSLRQPHNDHDDEAAKGETTATTTTTTTPLLHWARLEFHSPVYCPLDSLIIGSRLDTQAASNTVPPASATAASLAHATASAENPCRIAFSGRLVQKWDPQKEASSLRLYTRKEKRGQVFRLGDAHRRDEDGTVVRYQVFGTDLFKKETDMTLFWGLHLETDRGEVGVLQSSFGTGGKFRVHFPAGTTAREGDALWLRYRRYLHDETKALRQTSQLPPAQCGTRLVTNTPVGGPKTGKKSAVQNNHKKKSATTSSSSSSSKKVAPATMAETKTAPIPSAATTTTTPPTLDGRGEISAVKGDVLESSGRFPMAIVSGLFTPEMNIRDYVGRKVSLQDTTTTVMGSITGAFGKAGKCKVSFAEGLPESAIGTRVQLVEK